MGSRAAGTLSEHLQDADACRELPMNLCAGPVVSPLSVPLLLNIGVLSTAWPLGVVLQ